jgi:hypothetical protein
MVAKEISQWFKDCIKYSDNRPIIVLKDDKGKSEFRAINSERKKIIAIRVDDCLDFEGKQSDYLLIVCNDLKCEYTEAYFIELKGSDFIQAIRQIDNSFEALKEALAGINRIHARIIPTKISIPNLENKPPVVSLRNKLKKRNGNLKYQVKLEEQI